MISPLLAATVVFVIVLAVISAPWWWRARRCTSQVVSSHTERKVAVGILLLGLGLLAQPGWSQPMPTPGKAPHETMPTGTLDGILRLQPASGETRVLADQPFTVEVRMGEQVLVRVDKRTDTAGRFAIKNILSHRALAYFVEANVDGQLYRSLPLPLVPDVREQHFDVMLQPATASALLAPQALEQRQRDVEGGADNPGFMPNPVREVAMTLDRAQYVSLGLCGLVAFVLLWQGRRLARRARGPGSPS